MYDVKNPFPTDYYVDLVVDEDLECSPIQKVIVNLVLKISWVNNFKCEESL